MTRLHLQEHGYGLTGCLKHFSGPIAKTCLRILRNDVNFGCFCAPCPIYDKDIQQELVDTFELSWNDNIKSRWVNNNDAIVYRTNGACCRVALACYRCC